MYGINSLIKLIIRIDQKLSEIIIILNMPAEPQADQPRASNWLDNQDVMQKLKISESTLKRRRQEGIIPSTRIKGKYYYQEADIQELLNKGVNKTFRPPYQ